MAGAARERGSDELRLVGIGALIGVPAALVAALFLALAHELESWLWEDLPDALGRDDPPWFLIVGLPVVGALIVLAARRLLPGDGGHPPLEGLSSESTPLSHVPGVALAALGTLGFGAVLGPEAPVIALGSAVGLAVCQLVRAGTDDRRTAVLAGAGSFAAISALFGGPVVGGILLLEAGVGLGAALVPTLLPGFVAAAVGYVLFVGLGDWGGLDAPGLVVPDLPAYDGTRVADLVMAVAVGVATALAVAVAHRLGERVAGLAPRWGMSALLLAGGLAVDLLALAADGLGAEANDVLFSGQESVPGVVAEDAVSVVAVVLVAKLLAYAVSLGCGFRGGPIFPAVFLGVAIAAFGVVWFDASPTWAVAVGAAAGMAAQARLVVASLFFGALLVGTAGLDTAPAAVLATVAAWLTAAAVDRAVPAGGRTGEPEAASRPAG